MTCQKCGRGTFGRLCGACKGEPAAVRRRWEEQNAMTQAFKEGALAALADGKRHLDNPYHPTKDQPMRSDWYDGFDQAVVQFEKLRERYLD